MAKPPYFPFFYQDFLTGTRFFTNAQTGAYIRLLLDQWDLGELKEKHFAYRMNGISAEESCEIRAKFVQVKGRNEVVFRNKKMEDERRNVNKRSKIAKQNGLLGGFQRHSKSVANQVASQVANEVANEKLPNPNPNPNPNLKAKLKEEDKDIDPPLKRKTRWPEDFKLTEERKQYALAQGVPDPEAEWENMRLMDVNAQYRKIDWNAFWQTWCRSALCDKKPKTNQEDW